MKFPESFTTIDKLNFIERKVLINSILYYELDESLMPDEQYDKLTRLLAKKVRQYQGTNILKKTMYGYVFEDYTDGSTGFDLVYKLKKKDKDYLMEIIEMILKQQGKEKKK